jgi:hypothetical protein
MASKTVEEELDRPDAAGKWKVSTGGKVWIQVVVAETPTSGRFCRALRMGGCAQMGYGPWKGKWRRDR